MHCVYSEFTQCALCEALTVGYKLQAHSLYPDRPPYQAWTG